MTRKMGPPIYNESYADEIIVMLTMMKIIEWHVRWVRPIEPESVLQLQLDLALLQFALYPHHYNNGQDGHDDGQFIIVTLMNIKSIMFKSQ